MMDLQTTVYYKHFCRSRLLAAATFEVSKAGGIKESSGHLSSSG